MRWMMKERPALEVRVAARAWWNQPIVTEPNGTKLMVMKRDAEPRDLPGDHAPMIVGIFDGLEWRRIDIRAS